MYFHLALMRVHAQAHTPGRLRAFASHAWGSAHECVRRRVHRSAGAAAGGAPAPLFVCTCASEWAACPLVQPQWWSDVDVDGVCTRLLRGLLRESVCMHEGRARVPEAECLYVGGIGLFLPCARGGRECVPPWRARGRLRSHASVRACLRACSRTTACESVNGAGRGSCDLRAPASSRPWLVGGATAGETWVGGLSWAPRHDAVFLE